MENPKLYFINIVKAHFYSLNSEFNQKIEDENNLNEFITDISASAVSATVKDEQIIFQKGVSLRNDNCIVFVKKPGTIIASDNALDTISVYTLQNGPLASFYATLQSIFVPYLQNNDQTADPQIQQAAAALEAGLKRALNLDLNDTSTIYKVSDEVSHWRVIADDSQRQTDHNMANAFLEILQPFDVEISALRASDSSDLDELVESGSACVDELWRLEEFEYPEPRMRSLLDVIGDTLAVHVQRVVSGRDVWRDDYNSIYDLLTSGISACEKWVDSIASLCSVWWSASSARPWRGEPPRHNFCSQLAGKLRQVRQVRDIHRQLTRLLSSSERKELATDSLFGFFKGLSPGVWSPYTDDDWQAAVGQFDKALQATEQRVAAKLRTQLVNLHANTMQLLHELRRYQELMKRPRIASELIAERENLLGLLAEHVSSVDISRGDKMVLLDMPPVISNIYWARQVKAQMLDIGDTNAECLSDLKGSESLKQKTDAVVKELMSYEAEEVEAWVREITAGIKSRALTLSGDDNVLIMDGPIVVVNYSPRLGQLVREVQQLAVLGIKIPPKITELYKKAQEFVKQANALEQIAHFHNTIGDRMIPSQRPMMLAAAHALEQLVTSQQNVTWSQSDEIDSYIRRLQMAVEALSRQNNKLSFYHSKISQKVMQLMEMDLIKQQPGWKSGVREIRDTIMEVEEMNFSNMKSWRLHWDLQIYKALEHQYQLRAADLNSNLPEIKLQLVYRQQKLQFQPPLEEIKLKYYNQVKRFLSLPNSFRGVTDSSGPLFATIVQRNAHRFSAVFAEAERLFEQLEVVRLGWRRWLALGGFSLEQLAAETLEKTDDWDFNFRASKNLGQEIAKLPCDDVKVGCMTVSLLSIRAEMELQNRRYWDALSISLQTAIIRRVNLINGYMEESTASLNAPRHSMDQIAEAYSNHSKMVNSSSDVVKSLEETIKMNKTLASWTKEKMEIVTEAATGWDHFQGQLHNFESLISRQVEGMKMAVQGQVENLLTEVDNFRLRWQQVRPRDVDLPDASPQQLLASLALIKEKKDELQELKLVEEKLLKDFEQLGLPPPDLSSLSALSEELETSAAAWSLYEEFTRELDAISHEDWIIFRSKMYRLGDFLKTWEDKIESEEMTPMSVRLLQEIQSYKLVEPLLKYVRGDAFSDRHWVELLSMISVPHKPPEALTVGDFLQARTEILSSEEALQELNSRATSEIAVRQALSELDAWEVTAKFSLSPHTDASGSSISVVKDFGEVLGKLTDMQCVVQSVVRSAGGALTDRAEGWERKLVQLEECVKGLNTVQRKWIYLEPIFGNGSFALEQPRFQRVDQDYRHIMADIANDSHVCRLTRISNLRQTLMSCIEQLARCQAGLDQYLQEKRSRFPRFYFLGDDDLLELLGQANKESVIQAHLKKLFAGINSVTIREGVLTSVQSLQGEIVALNNPVRVTTSIEEWLSALNVEVKSTLTALLTKCLHDNDPNQYPGQILCLAEAIRFSANCESAIKSRKLGELLKDVHEKVASYSKTKVDFMENPILVIKLKSLLIDAVHFIEIVEELIRQNVSTVGDWHWQKRLRFYLNPKGVAVARMADAEFRYSYEYQGSGAKLVRTPLTEKCFLTLTQAMRAGLGGNPYGPAGTGKTESVKALGALLGRQVLVFNCDEGIDVESMARIFVGLVKCGAWGCFDEFNRLEETTLSGVSMLIQPILTALREMRPSVHLHNQDVDIDQDCGIFVTLNPAGQGYGGRQKLPDNLKALFRPVAMAAPDNLLIAQVSLLCDGFAHAKPIASKMVELFDFCQHSLSQQDHYDWGLRALKTVLGSCGSLLREKHKHLSEMEELETAVEAVRFNTLSKLTYSDAQTFDLLVKDVFLGVPFVTTGFADLTAALAESCTELGLQHIERQLAKCVEVWEQMQQRMGVALVGPPGAGKTTILSLLRHALVKMAVAVETRTLNPKAMPRAELLGYVDVDTRQWTEGALTSCAAQLAALPNDVRAWLICDGNVDPEWVESLNSVLDDNRLLTLPSGWRIQFGPNVNFVFETSDLTHASPATVSRISTIFLSEEIVDAKTLITTWLSQQPPEVADFLSGHLFDLLPPCMEMALKCGGLCVPYASVALTYSALSLLANVTSKSAMVVGLMHGLGANLDGTNRQKLAHKVLELTGEYVPSADQVLNSYFNPDRNRIDVYSDDISEQAVPGLVLTAAARRSVATLDAWLALRLPFLVCGPQGSGKGTLLQHCFDKMSGSEVATVYCSALSKPKHVLYKLRQVCVIAAGPTGRVYRPKTNSNLILYLKNVELCAPDKYGTNILIAWLQQLIVHGAFFDSDLERATLDHVQIVLSMNSQGYKPSLRASSQLLIYNYLGVDASDLKLILAPQIASLTKAKNLSTSVRPSAVLDTVCSIFKQITARFTSVQQRHYCFAPSVLTKWCEGVRRYPAEADAKSLMFSFVYEGLRIFGDRLVSDAEMQDLVKIFKTVMSSDWGADDVVADACNSYVVSTSGRESLERLSVEEWSELVTKGDIIAKGGESDLVMTTEVLRIAAAVSRTVSTPGGCILLLGRPGTGRKSASRAVASIQNSRLVTLNVTQSYDAKNFKSDLKTALQTAGVDGQQVILLLEDVEITQPVFLQMIASLISSGEVLGLYTAEELEAMVAPLTDAAVRDGHAGAVSAYFSARVVANLHVVLVLDFKSNVFADICEKSPSLLTKCDIVTSDVMSKETLVNVPKVLLESTGIPNLCDLHRRFSEIGEDVANLSATPRRYLSCVRFFTELYERKRLEMLKLTDGLQAGVSKLTKAQETVDKLKQQAAEQETKLAEKQAKASQALDMIGETMRDANVHKGEMVQLKSDTEKQSVILKQRKKEIELELAEVEPLIEEARKAVGNIKNESLSEIRSLRAPPDAIRDILDGVLRLMGIQDTSWNSMKTFLAKRGVKEEIRTFDAHHISVDNRKAAEIVLSNRSNSFDPSVAKRASAAAAPLAAWVKANVQYAKVVEKIRPLEREQSALEENLASAEAQVGQLSTGLSEVDKKVAELKEQLNTYTREAAVIEVSLMKERERMAAAQDLVGKLEGEYSRWKTQLNELTSDLKNLPQDVFLATTLITYLGGEPLAEREDAFLKWKQDLNRTEFVSEKFLSSEQQKSKFISDGLPSDQHSLQNGVILLNSWLVCRLVDPDGEAIEWLTNHFGGDVEIVSQNNPRFARTLELAVRFGKIIFVTDAQNVHPLLIPLIRRSILTQGTRTVVKIGDSLLDFNKSFRLFLFTRDVNFAPCYDTTTIDFTTTEPGLSGQLLMAAVEQEKPELGSQRRGLLKNKEDLQAKLISLQNELLNELGTAQGDILENVELLNSLNNTKASSEEIISSLEKSSVLESQLNVECAAYKPIANFAAKIFFALMPLSAVSNMYRFSVPAFKNIFLASLREKSLAFEDQKNMLVKMVYQYIGRCLFKADRLTFAIQLVRRCFPETGSAQEWSLLLRDTIPVSSKISLPDWLEDEREQDVAHLRDSLPSLFSILNLSDNQWRDFAQSPHCEDKLPHFIRSNITPLQTILIVQAFRPDRLHSVLTKFVCGVLGIASLTPKSSRVDQVYEMSKCSEPILLITSPGADPSEEVRGLSQKLKMELTEISLGQGQASASLAMLKNCASNGCWLLLKNCHLMTDWMLELDAAWREVQPHEAFRLWLTTEPHQRFPPVLLRSSLKLCYEAPPGIKQNLQRTYASWPADSLRGRGGTFARVLFAAAWFHAVVQERRTYIPQGWSKFYEITDADMSASKDLLDRIITKETKGLPWEWIRGLLEQSVYGGRIDSSQDERILRAYLRDLFSESTISGKGGLRNIKLPNSDALADYLDIIHELPNVDSPAMLSLAANIDRSWQKIASDYALRSLNSLNRPAGDLTNIPINVWHEHLSPILNLWKNLHQGQSLLQFKMSAVPSLESADPVSSCVIRQFLMGLKLVLRIHKGLAAITKTMRGSQIQDSIAVTVAESLLTHRCPHDWLRLWTGPAEPRNYLKSVVSRALALQQFLHKPILDSVIDLSHFFYPEAFFKAVKQMSARHLGVAVDELSLSTSWQQNAARSAFAARISNLLLEGAIFETSRIVVANELTPSITTAPLLTFTYVKKVAIESANEVQLPLYRSSDRQDLILNLAVNCEGTSDDWCKSGAAFFCAT